MSIALTAMDAIEQIQTKQCRSIHVQCDGKRTQLGAIVTSRFIDAARDQGGIVGAVRLHFMKHLQSTEDYTTMSRLQEGAFKLVVQRKSPRLHSGLYTALRGYKPCHRHSFNRVGVEKHIALSIHLDRTRVGEKLGSDVA